MTPKQVKDIFNNLPSKRRKVLEGFLAGHSREKIMIDAGVPSDAALTGHLKELYRNFRINTGWNDADDRRSGTRKLPLLISLFAKCMPELLSEHIPEVLENVEQEGASPKLSQESAEVADIKENSSQASPSIEISSIREWRLQSINQLWSKDIGECISGIRKLEIIAKDYPAEQWAVMEALAEFVKIRACQKEQKEGEEERSPKILECIKKALMVIGQPDFTKKNRLDLTRTNLAGVDLSQRQLNFELVDFTGANLTMANLRGTNFKGANFKEANLEYADFIGAILQTAIYDRRTLLTGAQFDEGIEWQLEGMCGWQLKIQKILRQWGCESVSDQLLETSFYTNPEEEDLFFPDSRPCKKGPLRRPTKRTKESGREVNPVE